MMFIDIVNEGEQNRRMTKVKQLLLNLKDVGCIR